MCVCMYCMWLWVAAEWGDAHVRYVAPPRSGQLCRLCPLYPHVKGLAPRTLQGRGSMYIPTHATPTHATPTHATPTHATPIPFSHGSTSPKGYMLVDHMTIECIIVRPYHIHQ